MTKFILDGGGEMGMEEKHDDFFREIINSFTGCSEIKILCVYFAVPDELVSEKHPIYAEYFKRNNVDKKKLN